MVGVPACGSFGSRLVAFPWPTWLATTAIVAAKIKAAPRKRDMRSERYWSPSDSRRAQRRYSSFSKSVMARSMASSVWNLGCE